MAGAPSVSIIIPNHNRPQKVLEALGSLSSPDLDEAEIIVVDDGSTDGSQLLDLTAFDPRARMILHSENRGGSAARNTGIDAARAPLVAFLDSDDAWLPGKFTRQLETIRKGGAGPDFIAAGNVLIRSGERLRPHNDRSPTVGESICAFLMADQQAIQTSTLLLPTALARRVRFREGLRRHQDWDFVLRLLSAGAQLLYDPEPLAIYNLYPDPVRISLRPLRLAATVEWYRLAGPLLSQRSLSRHFARIALSREGLSEPGATLRGLAWLAARDPMAMPVLAQSVVIESVAKLRGRARADA